LRRTSQRLDKKTVLAQHRASSGRRTAFLPKTTIRPKLQMRKVNTSESDGTVFRVVEYAPGVPPRKHRTNPIDYAVVMSGSIEVTLDNVGAPRRLCV
jgi:hypothetical protein